MVQYVAAVEIYRGVCILGQVNRSSIPPPRSEFSTFSLRASTIIHSAQRPTELLYHPLRVQARTARTSDKEENARPAYRNKDELNKEEDTTRVGLHIAIES